MPSSFGMPIFVKVPKGVDGPKLFRAAESLEGKLHDASADIIQRLSALENGSYWVAWFHRKSQNFLSYLQIYAYIISMATPESRPDFSKIRLLDVGAGWGLIALLAKQAGIGQVTYLDIDPGVSRAAKVVSETIGMPFDEQICGTAEVLLPGESGRFDMIVSSDFLEHVYDVDSAFDSFSHCCAPGGSVFHQTGANPKSPYQKQTLMRLHRSAETEDTKGLEQMHLNGETAIWEQRKEFIQEQAPEITGASLHQLSKSSRGLDQAGLQGAIDAYVKNGVFPVPNHPTNTCYLNGYWLD